MQTQKHVKIANTYERQIMCYTILLGYRIIVRVFTSVFAYDISVTFPNTSKYLTPQMKRVTCNLMYTSTTR